MKLFILSEIPPKPTPYLHLHKQSTQLLIEICKSLQISLPAMHASLWIFHCNAIIMGFHNFDRFVYVCGAILIGTKIMECLRYPVDIVRKCRVWMRKRKGIEGDQDSQEYLKKQVKRVFQSQINIMINIGFDLHLSLAIDNIQPILNILSPHLPNLPIKLKQTLTSLYCTEIVVIYGVQVIIGLALRVLIRAQGWSMDLLGDKEGKDGSIDVKELINRDQVKEAEREYLKRCIFQ